MYVADDAGNRVPGRVRLGGPEFEASAGCVASGKIALRHGLIDHGDQGRTCHVMVVEITSRTKRNSQGLEVLGADSAIIRRGRLTLRRRRRAFHIETTAAAAERQREQIDDANGFHSRHFLHAAQNLPNRGRTLFGRGITRRHQVQAHRENARRIEARLNVCERCEAAQSESGCHEQRERKRRLRHHQPGPQTRGAARAQAPRTGLENLIQIRTATGQRGSESEKRTGHERDSEREGGHAEVHGSGKVVGCRVELANHQVGGNNLEEAGKSQVSDHKSSDSTRDRHHGAFGKKLAQDRSSRRAKSCAHGHFSLAGQRSRQEKIGDIGANQHQNQPRGGSEQEQNGAEISVQLLAQGYYGCTNSRVGFGMVELEPPGDFLHLNRGSLHRRVLVQPGHHLKKMGAARSHARRVHRERRPHVSSAGGKRKGRRHHAGNRVAISIQRDAAADHIAGSAEMAPPKRIADDRDPRAGLIVVLLEVAAESQRHAQYAEKV